MASTKLTPRLVAEDDSAMGDLTGPLIRRPAELVELAELVYRGVFSAALAVAAIGTGYAIALAALQPPGHRAVSALACSLLLAAQAIGLLQRSRLYAALRSRPWLILGPSVAVGAAGWMMGHDNQQTFYILIFLIGALGLPASFRLVSAASLVAAAGLAAPHIADGSYGTIGIALAAAILPPLFWLIVDRLARFMLRLHRITDSRSDSLARPSRVANLAPRGARTDDQALAEPLGDEARVEATIAEDAGADLRGLTNRQLEVLLLVAEGLKNVQIGACLGIGAAQVGRHLTKARRRAGVGTDAELMAWARRQGLLPDAAGFHESVGYGLPHPQN